MTAFLFALCALIVGYFVYGKIVEHVFGPTDRPTPALRHNDGVDYIPLPTWKVFMIQLLNIAGLGPIFGALGGAIWGPSVYFWIVFGTIFAGGVHDYLSGMISLRSNGASLPEIVGWELGNGIKQVCSLVQHLSEVAEPFSVGVFGHHFLGVGSTHIYVAEGGHLYHAGAFKFTDNLFAAIANTDVGYLHLVFDLMPLSIGLCIQ